MQGFYRPISIMYVSIVENQLENGGEHYMLAGGVLVYAWFGRFTHSCKF